MARYNHSRYCSPVFSGFSTQRLHVGWNECVSHLRWHEMRWDNKACHNVPQYCKKPVTSTESINEMRQCRVKEHPKLRRLSRRRENLSNTPTNITHLEFYVNKLRSERHCLHQHLLSVFVATSFVLPSFPCRPGRKKTMTEFILFRTNERRNSFLNVVYAATKC